MSNIFVHGDAKRLNLSSGLARNPGFVAEMLLADFLYASIGFSRGRLPMRTAMSANTFPKSAPKMRMTRQTSMAATLLAVWCLGFGSADRLSVAAEDPHAYFNSLVRRSDHWKSYSLRDPAQLGGPRQYATYDPPSDSHRQKQDAVKLVIPAFYATTKLAAPLSATDTVLTLDAAYKPSFPKNRVIGVGREAMTVTAWLNDTTVSVARGAHGTTPEAHVAGAPLLHATNSLRSQVRVPLETEDGHDYFFVWDSYWTDSFMDAGKFNHKAFQFSSGGKDGDTIWLEPQMAYGTRCAPETYVGAFGLRSYNKTGGNPNWSMTDGNFLGPGGLGTRGQFCILPNTWTRFFVRIQQRANDYDLVDVWLADETRDAVQVFTNAQVSVRSTGKTPNSIAKFWLEFNSSSDKLLRADRRDLVAYVRNFVALRDLRDPRALLVRPVAGVPTVAGPRAPTNLRILQ